VVAVPEFSMRPRNWCFPVAGCVSYRGYFDKKDAEKYAANLAKDGFDVATLFHELAHQLLYIQDDSSFNEAFATFVEREGFRTWLRSHGKEDRIEAYEQSLARGNDFAELLKSTRDELVSAFAQTEIDEAARRSLKEEVFANMQTNYAELKSVKWNDYTGYDRWFGQDLNNAHLLGVSTYRRLVPAFRAMFEEAGSDLPAFYELAKEVANLPTEARNERMASYDPRLLN